MSVIMDTDVEWERDWFSHGARVPNSNWKSLSNCRQFLDEFAMKFNIERPSDWGKISTSKIHEAGGGALLVHYFDGSLFKCLQTTYQGAFVVLAS